VVSWKYVPDTSEQSAPAQNAFAKHAPPVQKTSSVVW